MKKRKEKKEVILTNIIIKRSLIIILFDTDIQIRVDRRTTLAQLKEKLVPLIGVPPTGFIVYRISGYGEFEMEGVDIKSGSKVVYCVIYFSFPLYLL